MNISPRLSRILAEHNVVGVPSEVSSIRDIDVDTDPGVVWSKWICAGVVISDTAVHGMLAAVASEQDDEVVDGVEEFMQAKQQRFYRVAPLLPTTEETAIVALRPRSEQSRRFSRSAPSSLILSLAHKKPRVSHAERVPSRAQTYENEVAKYHAGRLW